MPPLTDREIRKRRRARVIELLKQGCTTRQIHERTGMTTRNILRIRKDLEQPKEKAGA